MCASASVGRTAVRFSPQGKDPGREQVPAAMIPWRIDGLYVVDVIDGEWAPVCLTTMSRARDRTRRGGRPDGSPFEVQGTAPGENSQGSACTGG